MLDVSWSKWMSPTSLAVTALAGLLGGYYWMWSRSRFVRLIDALPGPNPLPLLGNILDLLKFSPDEMLLGMNHRHPIYKFWISRFFPVVFIAHPELCKPILSSNKYVTRPQEYNFVFPENSLPMLAGDPWKKRRRMLNPAFHFQNLNGFLDIFNDLSLDYAAKIERIILGTASSITGCQEIDVHPIMSLLALDLFAETSLGGQVWSEEESIKFTERQEKIEYIFMERSVYEPWLRIDWIYKLSSLYRQELQLLSSNAVAMNKIIQSRREFLKQNADKYSSQSSDYLANNNYVGEGDTLSRPKERLTFLDLLLKASEENPDDLNDEVLSNEVCLFIAGSIDTTAVAMAWFLYLMAKCPEHQQLVTDELNLIFGDSDRPVTAHDLTRLKYLECCIKETLRLYPPFPVIVRYLTEEVQIGDYTLPKDLTVLVNIYGTHRNAEFFPDPDSFKPERFLPENSVDRHPYVFIPFSAGVRNCIAPKYAMMEMKVALANILRRLKFSLSDPSGPLQTPAIHVMLKPKDGKFNLIVSKRLGLS